MELTTVWFALIALLWCGYFMLEGFDFGVGALLPALGRDGATTGEDGEKRRRLMLTTIGPHWDGNEVWLITAVGAMFAAFPVWYATLFSSFYLPMLVVLMALILRNVGLEYRHKRQDARWIRGWDRCIVVGSLATPFVLGTMVAALVGGLPLDARGDVSLVGALVRPTALLGGLAMVGLAVVHGAMFLSLKTVGAVSDDARQVARRGLPAVLVVLCLYASWIASDGPLAGFLAALSVTAFSIAIVLCFRGRMKASFVGSMVAIGSIVGAAFARIFPFAIPSSLNPVWSLSLHDAASSPYTLGIMTWAAVIFLPITLLYTAYSYWVFRRRISLHQLAVH
ncbi:cytochrome d ubiquinol oxidase subunit II [Demetria terragena]|uniref:cytochrome d ubiquinol oxidase subunit II n=1 Tax=Demetria terragena TaxID=63959 RepID=UPI0003721CEC|nr:cytochrome d ubiquinol oxidase subunit II [Demetria terragena]